MPNKLQSKKNNQVVRTLMNSELKVAALKPVSSQQNRSIIIKAFIPSKLRFNQQNAIHDYSH